MTQPTVLDILDAVIADRRNLSGQWIADGIAEYRRAPLQPQTGTQPAQADNPHAQPQKRQNDAGNGARGVVSVTDGGGVNTAVNPDNDTLDWLSDMTDADSVNVVSGLQPHPVSGREKRLSRLRQAPADTSPKGTGAGGVKWVDGELDKVLTLSKERQKVWRWLKGLTVTPSEPSCWDAAAETGISQQTANKAIKQYRDFHGIF